MNSQRTIVQMVHLDDTGDSCQRMKWPAEHLALQAPEWRVINCDFQHKDRWTYALEADLLVLIQSSDPDMLGLIEKRRALGKKTLVEYNDNFYSPQPWSPLRKDWTNPFVWQIYEHFMERADGILVTGQGLYNLFSQKFKTPIFILPNHYHDEMPSFDDTYRFKGASEIRIGWAGSLGHMADLLSIMPLFQELTQVDPSLRIYIMGNESIPKLAHLPEAQFHFRKWGGMKDYFDFWREVHVGVVPLIDTPYNRCRSDAKAMEMTACGVLPLLPEATCYETFIAESGLEPYRNQRDLRVRLESLIHSPEKIRGQAQNLYRFVGERRHHRVRRERLEIYSKFVANAPASSFRWPMPAGYHEVKDVAVAPQWAEFFSSIQNALKEKKWGEVYESLQKVCSDYEHLPDFDFLFIQVKTRLERSFFRDDVRALQKEHRLDWRFSLFEIQASSPEMREGAWNFFLNHVAHQPQEVYDYFLPDLVRLLELELQKYPWAFKIAEEISQRFERKPAALTYILATAYERLGDHARAFQLMRAVTEKKRAFDRDRVFLEKMEGYYFEAWDAALHERCSSFAPSENKGENPVDRHRDKSF